MQTSRVMKKRHTEIMGVSKTHWTGKGKLVLEEGQTIIYYGRQDNGHREGVSILMSKSATRALIDRMPVNEWH